MSKAFVIVVLVLTLFGEMYRIHLIAKTDPALDADGYRSTVLAGNIIEAAATVLAIVVTAVSL